jgi:RNA polymerase sigma-70 factor (ECF subfamily)
LTDDAELMRRVREGDEVAFGALMAEWELPVKRVLGRIVQNSADADDLAQETFIRIWQNRERFLPGAAFRPWMFAIAVNLARNRLRWWRRRPLVELEDWEIGESSARTETALERKERAEAVRTAVGRLPLDQREVLVLFSYEGLSHAEIAASVGGTPKSIEAKLYRAREKLRSGLRHWVEDAGGEITDC